MEGGKHQAMTGGTKWYLLEGGKPVRADELKKDSSSPIYECEENDKAWTFIRPSNASRNTRG